MADSNALPKGNLKVPLPAVEPGERKVAVVLLVDISSSMNNPQAKPAIQELQEGLAEFGKALKADRQALDRVEVSVVSFNSTVQTEVGWRPAREYDAPTLAASGLTSFNKGIGEALDKIEERKAYYKKMGIDYYRPWLFALTDGMPTDSDMEAAARTRLQEYIDQKKVVYIPMGMGLKVSETDSADDKRRKEDRKKKLQSYYPENAKEKPVYSAEASDFKSAFKWLSTSIILNSKPGVAKTDDIIMPPVPESVVIGT